jgi:hypothetical protein
LLVPGVAQVGVFCLEREDCGGDMADMAGVWVCILYVNILFQCEV